MGMNIAYVADFAKATMGTLTQRARLCGVQQGGGPAPLPNLFFSTCLSFIFPCYNHAWRMLIAIAILLTENRKYGFFIMKRSVHDNGVSYRLLLQTITTHQAYKHVASGSQRTYRCGVAQRLSVAAFCKKNDQRRRDPLWR